MATRFESRTEWDSYLDLFPETGKAYPSLRPGATQDIAPQDFMSMTMLVAAFAPFTECLFCLHPETHELFLGDMNHGGHAPRCRLVKVDRDTMLDNAVDLESWYDDFGAQFWR